MNTTETKVEKFTGKWAGRPLEGGRFNRAIECMDACAGIADPQSAIKAARDALKAVSCAFYGDSTGYYHVSRDAMEKARQALERLG
jgi:hypothetical protein